MKFIHDDFLLTTDTSRRLYHEYAEKMPIIDYHCHLDPRDIAEDRVYENITRLWLSGDHYKWRLMRNCGISEKYITGDADDKEKFIAWASVLEKCIGNPLYHWSMLELARYFDYEGVLTASSGEKVWDHCNEVIRKKKLSAKKILKESGVETICTTDNPEDDLRWHRLIREDKEFEISVLPAFRPDKAFKIEADDFRSYMNVLATRFSRKITSYSDLVEVLHLSINYFNEMGCRTSDHGLDFIPCRYAGEEKIEEIFQKGLRGEVLSEEEKESYRTRLLTDLAEMYSSREWVMQLHYGASRNNSSLMFEKLGPDTGYDCISGKKSGNRLPQLLDMMENRGILPKTVVYSLDPVENAMIDTVCGCYSQENVRGKVQHGSAWWFNDHLQGMRDHLENLASHSVLANFIGMLTDSRSLLSYTRHEYFRRILCQLMGEWVEQGWYPDDTELLGKMVQDISYYNTLEFFQFENSGGGMK
ncbi:MAG: glucuronate isomerase [Emergencia sp.]